MCGRYTLHSPAEVLAKLLALEAELPPLSPRYNVAPGQDCPVVGVDPEGRRKLRMLRWGLVPRWSKQRQPRIRPINARSETAGEKPTFRVPLRRRRVLVPTDGFYEWKRTGSAKQPFLVRLRSREPMILAGLWDRWEGPGEEPLDSFAILTTEACPELADLHPRMPVLVAPGDQARWLDPGTREPETLADLLVPFPGSALDRTPVHPRVGKVSEDDPELLLPFEDPSEHADP